MRYFDFANAPLNMTEVGQGAMLNMTVGAYRVILSLSKDPPIKTDIPRGYFDYGYAYAQYDKNSHPRTPAFYFLENPYN